MNPINQGCRSRSEPGFLAGAGAEIFTRLRLLLRLYSTLNILFFPGPKYDYDYDYDNDHYDNDHYDNDDYDNDDYDYDDYDFDDYDYDYDSDYG